MDAFEEKHIDYLLKSQVGGWNLWHCLKKPLYNELRQASINAHSTNFLHAKSARFQFLLTAISYVAKLIWFSITKRGATILVTDTSNKLGKEEGGKTIDPFLDYLILTKTIEKYIYLESYSGKCPLSDSAVRSNVNMDGRLAPVNILKRYYRSKSSVKTEVRSLQMKLAEVANEGSYTSKISFELLLNLICRFLAQVRWERWVFGALRPKRLLIVDGIPDGIMAAAKQLGIKSYEFQHGFISYNKPEYHISPKFKSLKKSMPIADAICVFGEYFKDYLLQSGFWDKEEIVTLGSSIIERKRMQNVGNADCNVINGVFIGQPSVFQHGSKFLEELSKISFRGKIFIKPHPLEREDNIGFYNKLAESHPDKFTIVEAEQSLLDVLVQKNLLIGYHSTSLLEAAAVGIPCITIATEAFPNGINDLLTGDFHEVFKSVNSVEDLTRLLDRFTQDGDFVDRWRTMSKNAGHYFYAEGYFNRIKHFRNSDNNN